MDFAVPPTRNLPFMMSEVRNKLTFLVREFSSPALILAAVIGGAVCLGISFIAPAANTSFSFITGYAGVMLLVVAGTQAWIQRIDHQPDLDSAGREQNRNAVLVGVDIFGGDHQRLTGRLHRH